MLDSEFPSIVDQYVDDGLSGRIPLAKPTLWALQRHRDDLERSKDDAFPYEFNETLGALVCEWMRTLVVSGGSLDGQQMTVFPWQAFFYSSLFGWLRKGTKFRRFRNGYLSVGRGNGKSPMAAAVGLRVWCDDYPQAENAAEAYSIATKRDQAKIVWSDARMFVDRSIFLQKYVRRWKHSLTIDARGSKFLALASDSTSLDGLRPNVVLMDELHAYKEQHRPVMEKIRTALAKKPQSLWLTTTTAGNEESTVWQSTEDEMRAILDPDNTYENDETFALIYTIDEEDDPLDESCWPKANPMLEHGIVQVDQLRELKRKCEVVPSVRSEIERYHCNRKTYSTDKPITTKLWRMGDGEIDWESLTGRDAFIGFDWGLRDDLAAMALVIPLGGDTDECGDFSGRYAIKAKAWMPSDGKRSLDAYPFREFIKDGLIEVTEGDTTDTAAMWAQLLEWQETYYIQSLAADRSYAREFLTKAFNEQGINVFEFSQTCAKYHEPVQEFLRALKEKRIVHAGCKLLEWSAGNMVLKADTMDRVMPSKKKSADKIDPIVCVIMALSEAMYAERASGGFYSDGGSFVV